MVLLLLLMLLLLHLLIILLVILLVHLLLHLHLHLHLQGGAMLLSPGKLNVIHLASGTMLFYWWGLSSPRPF